MSVVGYARVVRRARADAGRVARLRAVAAMQVEYSLVERNAELEFSHLATDLGMGLVPWSPLGMGLLSGKYRPSQMGPNASSERVACKRRAPREIPPRLRQIERAQFRHRRELEKVAKEAGVSMAQAALNWLLAEARRVEHHRGCDKPAAASRLARCARVQAIAEHVRASTPSASRPNRFLITFSTRMQQARITGGVQIDKHGPHYYGL